MLMSLLINDSATEFTFMLHRQPFKINDILNFGCSAELSSLVVLVSSEIQTGEESKGMVV